MRNLKFIIRQLAFAFLASCVLSASSSAADPSDLSGNGQHRLSNVDSAPGMIGRARTLGYFQPIALSGPDGVGFAMSRSGAFGESDQQLMAGLMIGSVYRFLITGIPDAEGAELYPSIEVIDRTFPPPGLETTYPIQIVLDDEDLSAALNGQMVTKVIYLEDPQTAFAEQEKPTSGRTVEISEYQDPLEVSDRLGRPVAIVRIGTLAPPNNAALSPQFFFGDPPWAPIFRPEVAEVVEALPTTEWTP